MTGSDKIAAEILNAARREAEARLREADEQAAACIEEAKASAGGRAEAILAEGRREEEAVRRAAHSAAALLVRNAKLQQRRRELDGTVSALLGYLAGLPDGDYFDALFSLLARSVQPGDGVLYLNARDLARLPAGFEARLAALPAERGVQGSVALSKEPRELDGGFLLQYGEIEINAAFSALVEEKREALEDRIQRELFEKN